LPPLLLYATLAAADITPLATHDYADTPLLRYYAAIDDDIISY